MSCMHCTHSVGMPYGREMAALRSAFPAVVLLLCRLDRHTYTRTRSPEPSYLCRWSVVLVTLRIPGLYRPPHAMLGRAFSEPSGGDVTQVTCYLAALNPDVFFRI